MFGVTPGIYKDIIAAKLAAKGYEKEEGQKWLVASKTDEFCNTFYKPYRKSDTDEVVKDGWVVYPEPENEINSFELGLGIDLDKLRDTLCDIATCEGEECRSDICPFYMGSEPKLKEWLIKNIL